MYGSIPIYLLSISLDFLAFVVTIYLLEGPTSCSQPTNTQDLLQSFHPLSNAID
jgi:hypothetical protein